MWRSVVIKKCLAVALEGGALSSPPPLFSSTSPTQHTAGCKRRSGLSSPEGSRVIYQAARWEAGK